MKPLCAFDINLYRLRIRCARKGNAKPQTIADADGHDFLFAVFSDQYIESTTVDAFSWRAIAKGKMEGNSTFTHCLFTHLPLFPGPHDDCARLLIKCYFDYVHKRICEELGDDNYSVVVNIPLGLTGHQLSLLMQGMETSGIGQVRIIGQAEALIAGLGSSVKKPGRYYLFYLDETALTIYGLEVTGKKKHLEYKLLFAHRIDQISGGKIAERLIRLREDERNPADDRSLIACYLLRDVLSASDCFFHQKQFHNKECNLDWTINPEQWEGAITQGPSPTLAMMFKRQMSSFLRMYQKDIAPTGQAILVGHLWQLNQLQNVCQTSLSGNIANFKREDNNPTPLGQGLLAIANREDIVHSSFQSIYSIAVAVNQPDEDCYPLVELQTERGPQEFSAAKAFRWLENEGEQKQINFYFGHSRNHRANHLLGSLDLGGVHLAQDEVVRVEIKGHFDPHRLVQGRAQVSFQQYQKRHEMNFSFPFLDDVSRVWESDHE